MQAEAKKERKEVMGFKLEKCFHGLAAAARHCLPTHPPPPKHHNIRGV